MPGPINPDRLCVILVSTRNPLNIGAAARAMCNFGFADLRLVQPYDLAFREARSAVGASSVLTDAKVFATVAEAVADCTLVIGTTAIGHRQLQHPLHILKDGAPRRSCRNSPRLQINHRVSPFCLARKKSACPTWISTIVIGSRISPPATNKNP